MLKLTGALILSLTLSPIFSKAATPYQADLEAILANSPKKSLEDIIAKAFHDDAEVAPPREILPPESAADRAQRLRDTPGLEMAIQSLLISLSEYLAESGLSYDDTEITLNELRPALIELSRYVPRLESPNPWVSDHSVLINYIRRLRDFARTSLIDAVSVPKTTDIEGLATEALVAYMATYLSAGRNAGSISRQRTIMTIGSLALSILCLAIKSDAYPAMSLSGSVAGFVSSLFGGYYVLSSMVGFKPWIPKFLKRFDERLATQVLNLALAEVRQEFKVLFKNTGFSLLPILDRARCEGFL